MWSIVPNCTTDSKLILHKIYPTYKYLFKIKVKQSYVCSNWNKEDTLEHFFYECDQIKKVWIKVEQYINFNTGKQIKLTDSDALIGYSNKSNKNIIL